MTDIVEAVARDIAEENGDDYDLIPKNKSEWNAKQGMFGGRCRDVNEPYQCDYDEMARAAILETLRQIREPLPEDTVEDGADAFHGCVEKKKALFETKKYKENGLTYRGVCPADWIGPVWQAMIDHLIAEIGDD